MSLQPENQAAAPIASCSSAGAGQSEFTPEERAVLLKLAHESILSALEQRETSLTSPSPHFSEPRGAFTTIYSKGQLRGCVGYVLPVVSLYRTVAETARAAAFEDTRFSPVTLEEARALEVSLSILSPLKAIHCSSAQSSGSQSCGMTRSITESCANLRDSTILSGITRE